MMGRSPGRSSVPARAPCVRPLRVVPVSATCTARGCPVVGDVPRRSDSMNVPWPPIVVTSLLACATSRTDEHHRATRPMPAADVSLVDQFLARLEHGGSLFGPSQTCTEWIVAPFPRESTGAPRRIEGRLAEAAFDAQGIRHYARYNVLLEEPVAEGFSLALIGRGSRVVGGPHGNSIARMCTERVVVRASAGEPDAVRIGDETWYLSRAACRAAPRAAALRAGCSAHGG